MLRLQQSAENLKQTSHVKWNWNKAERKLFNFIRPLTTLFHFSFVFQRSAQWNKSAEISPKYFGGATACQLFSLILRLNSTGMMQIITSMIPAQTHQHQYHSLRRCSIQSCFSRSHAPTSHVSRAYTTTGQRVSISSSTEIVNIATACEKKSQVIFSKWCLHRNRYRHLPSCTLINRQKAFTEN